MGFEISEEKLPVQEPENEKVHFNPETEKQDKLKKIKELMKEFVLTGMILSAGFGALEGAKAAGYIEKEKFKLEKVEDMECKDGTLKADVIRKYLESLPANWATGQVSAIEVVPSLDEQADAEYRPFSGKIEFNAENLKNIGREEVLGILAHEIGHGNDFSTDNELKQSDKDKLFMDLRERVRSSDRYLSPYIESLIAKHVNGVTIDHEYWAEVCSAYFTDPTTLNIKDFQLVDGVVHKNDPNYDLMDNLNKRLSIVGDIWTDNLNK